MSSSSFSSWFLFEWVLQPLLTEWPAIVNPLGSPLICHPSNSRRLTFPSCSMAAHTPASHRALAVGGTAGCQENWRIMRSGNWLPSLPLSWLRVDGSYVLTPGARTPAGPLSSHSQAYFPSWSSCNPLLPFKSGDSKDVLCCHPCNASASPVGISLFPLNLCQ